jgi:hypothetical protein
MHKIYLVCLLSIIAQISTAQTKRKTTTQPTVVVIQTPTTTTVVTPSPAPTKPVAETKKTYSSDLIVKADGTTIDAKILEVTPTEVIFKKFNNHDGPIFRLHRSDVKSIRYASGEVDNNIQIAPPSNTSQPNEAIVNSNISQTNQYAKPLFEGFNRKRFGILGGINSFKVNISSGTNSVKTSAGTGFNIGFIGDFPFSRSFSIRTSPYASFKNTINLAGNTTSVTSISGVVNGLYHISSTQGDFVVGGGLVLDYFLSGDSNGTTLKIGNNPKTDDILPLDYGVNIIGGYDARAWSASAFYTFGIANLNPSYGNGGTYGTYSESTSTVGLLLNYWFGN